MIGKDLPNPFCVLPVNHFPDKHVQIYGFADNNGQAGQDTYPDRQVTLIIMILTGNRILTIL